VLVRNILFPITTGLVVSRFKMALASASEPYTSNVKIRPKLPPDGKRSTRMVTVRDDSGPDHGMLTRRRYGVNVWAEDSVMTEKLALYLMAVARVMPDGKPITSTDSFSGPFEIIDTGTDLFTVNEKTLTHFFFTFRLSARGTVFAG
jgi:hypothetical protein